MRPREVIALGLAPLASGLLQGAVMRNAGAFVFGAVAGYVFAALVGLPALMFLRRRRWQSIGKYIGVGTLAGAASGVVLGLFWGLENYKWGAVVAGFLFFALHGLVVSLSYWLIAYAGAPDLRHGTEA